MQDRLLIDANPIIPSVLGQSINGVGRACYGLIKALSCKKDNMPFDITLYTNNLRGISPKSLDFGFEIRHLYWPHRPLFDSIASILKFREISTGYDLMHITHNYERVSEPERCIFTVHDAMFMHQDSDKFNYKELRKNMPKLLKRCKHIVTCSNYSKSDIVESMGINPGKIDVVYWGVDNEKFYKEKFQINNRIDYKYILSVSCGFGRKRTDVLIKEYLNNWTPTTNNHLILVWPNGAEYCAEIINGHPGSRFIHFYSFINDDELRRLYNGATATIIVSSSEGFCLPVIEAMACGCPVIASNNTAITEIAGDAALLIDEPLNGNLSDILFKIDNNEIDLNRLSEKGIEHAEKFKWEYTADQMINIYSKLMDIL